MEAFEPFHPERRRPSFPLPSTLVDLDILHLLNNHRIRSDIRPIQTAPFPSLGIGGELLVVCTLGKL